MATYVTTIESRHGAEEAFDYLADLRNFAEWDPGVLDAEQVSGRGPGEHTRFNVTVKAWPKPLTLTYETMVFERPHTVRVVAESDRLISDDTITVEPADDGCRVTYEANLSMKGWLSAADPVLGIVFDRIAGRAGDGLRGQLL